MSVVTPPAVRCPDHAAVSIVAVHSHYDGVVDMTERCRPIVAGAGRRPVPEAGATIESSSLVAVTNAVGRFQIENAPAGDTLPIVEV